MNKLIERLTILRELADSGDKSTVLFEIDKMISLEKQLRNKRYQIEVDKLQQEIQSLKKMLKETRKESKSRLNTIENLQKDLQIVRVKCKTLEKREQEHRKAAAREKRQEQKIKNQKCTEFETKMKFQPFGQFEFDEALKNFEGGLPQQINLYELRGFELEEEKEKEREESLISYESGDYWSRHESNPYAYFYGSLNNFTPSNLDRQDNSRKILLAGSNKKNQFWTTSKQTIKYYKES